MILDAIQGAFLGLIAVLIETAILWVSVGLAIIAWHMRDEYKKLKFVLEKEWSLLEIRLPQEIEKTPEAMEIIIGALHQGNKTWTSLEIVSIEGSVHFFVRVEENFKNIIESQIYAQYPQVEIYEVPDYTLAVDYTGDNPEGWKLWVAEMKLKKDDPYPIKTYIDYQLDKPGSRDDNRVDPLSSLIEQLGALGPGEQAWIQILMQETQDKLKLTDWWFEYKGWKDEGNDLIKELREKGREKDDDGNLSSPDRTEGERLEIDAVERNISKAGFDCGIRICYLGVEDSYSKPHQLGIVTAFRAFGSETLNSFGVDVEPGFKYKWQDLTGKREESQRRTMFNAYRKRSYFYPPYYGNRFVLNSEELATIFHFPGGLITTPTLSRITSRKVEPPSDLPL